MNIKNKYRLIGLIEYKIKKDDHQSKMNNDLWLRQSINGKKNPAPWSGTFIKK
jgi:hypothetical protein